jgi:hypothetical protein
MEASKREVLPGEDTPKTADGQSSAGAGVETPATRKPDPASVTELTSDKIMPLIQKIAAGSIAEIEKVIGELQATRDFLRAEGERIEQETIRFAQLNRTASASVKIISESISEWLQAGGHVRSKAAV